MPTCSPWSRIARAVAAVALFALAACGGRPVELVALRPYPGDFELTVGALPAALWTTGIYSDGSEESLGSSWWSSNDAVARVDACTPSMGASYPCVVAVSPGQAVLTASYGELRVTTLVTVR